MSNFSEWRRDAQAQRLSASNTSLPLSLVEAATLFSYRTMRETDGLDIPAPAAAMGAKRATHYYLASILMELALYGHLGIDDRPIPLENHASYLLIMSGIASRHPGNGSGCSSR